MKRFFISCFILLSAFGFAQDGSLDTSFGTNGIFRYDFNGEDDFIKGVTQLTSGDYLVSGSVTIQGENSNVIMKITEDGNVDSSFGEDGILELELGGLLGSSEDYFYTAGPILLNDVRHYFYRRYFLNGTRDTSFGTGGSLLVNLEENDFLRWHTSESQEIFRIDFYQDNDRKNVRVFKYNADGELDVNYGVSGQLEFELPNTEIELSSVIVHNEFLYFISDLAHTANPNLLIYKTTFDGSPISSFGIDGLSTTHNFDNLANKLGFGLDGTIYISAWKGYCKMGTYSSSLRRILPSGILDSSFGNSGLINLTRSNFIPSKIHVQPNGRVLVSGNSSDCFESFWFNVFRYFPSGSLDTSFGSGGISGSFLSLGQDVSISRLQIQEDGKVLISGYNSVYFDDLDFVVIRYNNNPLNIDSNAFTNPTIYPNPSSGVFNLKLASFTSEIPYQITDVTGKIIQEGYFSEAENQIDISTTANGIYFLTSNNSLYRLIKK